MADLDLRFDDITEQYFDRQLAEIREFARSHPLPDAVSMEIGSNKGKFIRGLARANPDRYYLGIEIRRKWARMANKSYEREGLSNAHVMHADANLAVPVLLDDGQLHELFVLYPDPWWKARHRKRRVIRTESLDLLARKMAPGGKLWIRTDVGSLANDMRADLNAHPEFEPTQLSEYPLTPFPYSERDDVTITNELPVQLLYYTRK